MHGRPISLIPRKHQLWKVRREMMATGTDGICILGSIRIELDLHNNNGLSTE